MLSVLQSVLEPFLLIALGYALSGTKLFSAKSLWDGVEKLVFWVLFPPLLFNSVARASLSGVPAGKFLLVGTFAMAVGVLMAKVVSRLAPADPRTDASVRQTGYRFNSYICFALALNMYGEEVLALTALLTGVWVPISNAIAVADLSMAADKKGKTGPADIAKAIFTNPLIVATLAGLAANLLGRWTGFAVPSFLSKFCDSLGSASTATALLSIGAGLAVTDFSRYAKLITLSTLQRLAALPAFALCIALAADLGTSQTAALMCYAVVPTANSCFIMAARMEGNGAVVSDLTSIEVLMSLVTIPLWFVLLRSLGI